MGLRKGQNNGNHGKKGASGRKPSAFTLLKRRIESEKSDDAEYAFALYSQVMRDETNSTELRLQCADWIANRVLGKPAQMIGGMPDRPISIVLKVQRDRTTNRTDDPPDTTASEATGNKK